MSKGKERKERKKADIPEMETKEQRFVRVVAPRIRKTIINIRLIKQTVSGANYSMTSEQVSNTIGQLTYEIEGIQSAFDSRNKSKKDIEVNL